MWILDDWHDAFRVVDLVMAVACVVLLARRFSSEWNAKTKDYWYAMVLWSVASIVLALEGMIEDRGLDPRLVFYFTATAVTLKGLRTKDSWGGRE